MWLSDFILKKKNISGNARFGDVSQSDKNEISAVTSLEQRKLPAISPYGIAYCVPVGEKCAVLPLESGEACIGVVSDASSLSPGEIMLYSKGGASIVLKNDGSVLINGKVVGEAK